jgi:hypothetical protein
MLSVLKCVLGLFQDREITNALGWWTGRTRRNISITQHFIFRWPRISVQFLLITNLTHFFKVFIYFTSPHVSSNPVLVIRIINLSIHHLVYCLVCRSGGNCSPLLTGIPDSHLHRVIYTRWCVDTIDSPDDEHCVARKLVINKKNFDYPLVTC